MSQIFSAQCHILGAESIKVGDSLKYSSEVVAKCIDCYTWNVSSEHLSITDNKEGQITLKALKSGITTINLKLEAENGSLSCEKSIEIKDNNGTQDKRCEVDITDFKDVKVDEQTISFFPNINTQKYKYFWKASYSDGSTKESTEKIPQFSNNAQNYIQHVVLKIENAERLCSVMITHSYTYNMWFPKVIKIEQRKYMQGSYEQNKTNGN